MSRNLESGQVYCFIDFICSLLEIPFKEKIWWIVGLFIKRLALFMSELMKFMEKLYAIINKSSVCTYVKWVNILCSGLALLVEWQVLSILVVFRPCYIPTEWQDLTPVLQHDREDKQKRTPVVFTTKKKGERPIMTLRCWKIGVHGREARSLSEKKLDLSYYYCMTLGSKTFKDVKNVDTLFEFSWLKLTINQLSWQRQKLEHSSITKNDFHSFFVLALNGLQCRAVKTLLWVFVAIYLTKSNSSCKLGNSVCDWLIKGVVLRKNLPILKPYDDLIKFFTIWLSQP